MKKFLLRILWLVLLVVLVLAAVLVMACIYDVVAPAGCLFYESAPLAGILMGVLLVTPAFYILEITINAIGKRWGVRPYDTLGLLWLGKRLGKWKIPVAVVWLIGLYCCFASTTYVTPDQIVVASPFNPGGATYDYGQVEQIETGFGSKRVALYEYNKQGNFFYKITLDGEEIVFHTPTVSTEDPRYEDSYLELEEFDQQLTKLGIPKTSSEENYEHCDYDQRYVDRFLRIVRNK